MVDEYEEILTDTPEELQVLEDDSRYRVYHHGLDESFDLLTENDNLTVPAAYIFEEKFNVDTRYGFSRLLQAKDELEDQGFLQEGNLAVNIPDDWKVLYDESHRVERDGYGANFDERASEVAKVIEKLDKSQVTSKEIAEHLDLNARQVAKTMRGLADEEGIQGELGRRRSKNTLWNIEMLDYDTDIVVEFD